MRHEQQLEWGRGQGGNREVSMEEEEEDGDDDEVSGIWHLVNGKKGNGRK